MKAMLKGIIEREIARLDEKSKSGPLDTEDVKSLESLTRSLKQMEDAPQAQSTLDNISEEDLLTLAKMETSNERRHNAEPRPENVRGTANGAKKGNRRTLEKREDSRPDT